MCSRIRCFLWRTVHRPRVVFIFSLEGLVAISASSQALAGEETNPEEQQLTIRALLVFYAPIAFSFFLAISTHSLFNAGLARLSQPEVYISAFAVARSLMHVFESPMIMITQTVAALADGPGNYRKVRTFTLGLLAVIVGLLAFFTMGGLANAVFVHVMDLRGDTLAAANIIMRVFIAFPCASAVKFFMQGIMIRLQVTPLLSAATIIRIGYVVLFILNIDRLTMISEAAAAGLMFFTALAMEGLLLLIGARLFIGRLPEAVEKASKSWPASPRLTYPMIISFFSPLILTSIIRTLAMPVINTGLARTPSPELALSAYAVAWGLAMIIMSPSIMFHQVSLSFAGRLQPERLRTIKLFALLVGLAMSFTMAVLAFSDGAYFILTRLIGASSLISQMAVEVLKVGSILPLLMIGREFYWGILAKQRLTKYLGISKVISVVMLTVTVGLLSLLDLPNPAVIGILAMMVSEAVEFTFLYVVTHRNTARAV